MFANQTKHINIRAQQRKNFSAEVSRETDYPHRLSFYSSPPFAEITIEEFQSWAIDRLVILGEIEAASYRGKTVAEIAVQLKVLLEKNLTLSSNNSRTLKGNHLEKERRKDYYSHFILRLAFCRSEDLRIRFVRAETLLFKIRFSAEDHNERNAFLSTLNLNWQIVSLEEKQEIVDHLAATAQKNIDNESYFKVVWTKVADLVQHRRVYLKGGYAFVPVSEQMALVATEFSARLSQALENTAKAIPRLDEDDRLLPVLEHLSQGFTAPEYTSIGALSSNSVNAQQVAGLVNHFPLCMRVLQDNLAQAKHLKHFGRLQYGLFLKGIGLSVEEALVFWRRSFSAMTDDKFNKEYRYNVRHSYGLEGNRRNYKPYSCQQILTGPSPGVGDAHGCPYRHLSRESLAASLGRLGVEDKSSLKEIYDAIESKHFHIACTKVFEVTHPEVALKETISHPNMYYERSIGLNIHRGANPVEDNTPRRNNENIEETIS